MINFVATNISAQTVQNKMKKENREEKNQRRWEIEECNRKQSKTENNIKILKTFHKQTENNTRYGLENQLNTHAHGHSHTHTKTHTFSLLFLALLAGG